MAVIVAANWRGLCWTTPVRGMCRGWVGWNHLSCLFFNHFWIMWFWKSEWTWSTDSPGWNSFYDAEIHKRIIKMKLLVVMNKKYNNITLSYCIPVIMLTTQCRGQLTNISKQACVSTHAGGTDCFPVYPLLLLHNRLTAVDSPTVNSLTQKCKAILSLPHVPLLPICFISIFSLFPSHPLHPLSLSFPLFSLSFLLSVPLAA